MPDSLKPLIGEVIAGRYRVEKCIGIGGMAIVFLGRHEALDRSVAIKVLRPELEEVAEVVDRFNREARIASHLEHPNCIQVFDVGVTKGGFTFMVMPFLDGTEISRVVSIPFAPSQAVALTTQVASGLEYIHRCGVIHRDLKPDNVFATRNHDGRTVLRVVDFGVSKLLDRSQWRDPIHTQVGTIVGTPSHMSPEQALGLESDERSDLYALGILLYQFLAARLPFDHDDPKQIMRQQINKPPPPLPERIPERLRRITMKLLAKRPEERFQSASEVVAVLKQMTQELAHDPQPWRPVLPEQAKSSSKQVGPALGSQTMIAEQSRSDSMNRPPSERSGHRAINTSELPVVRNPTPYDDSLGQMGAALDSILGSSESRSDMRLEDILGDIEQVDEGVQANEPVGPVPPKRPSRG